MKKAMIALGLVLVGCGGAQPSGSVQQQVGGFNNYVQRVRVGSCFYVVLDAYKGGGIVHAGDCPNHEKQAQ